MIKQQFVDEGKWLTQEQFNRVYAFYQIMPGPEATELCCYFGLLAGGPNIFVQRLASVIAGLGFVIPGFFSMLTLSIIYAYFGTSNTYTNAAFKGVQPAICALIVRAIHKIGDHGLSVDGKVDFYLVLVCVTSVIQSVMNVPFFITLFVSGLFYNFLTQPGRWYYLGLFLTFLISVYGLIGYIVYCYLNGYPEPLTIGGPALATPALYNIFLLGLLGGCLTFGGAYTAIPFIQQTAVINGNWLTNQQFIDGIALGSVVPSPLVIFVTFIGFITGFKENVGIAFAGSILMTIGMFIPAFSFTVVGHDLFERLIGLEFLRKVLDGTTASAVGLIVVSCVSIMKSSITNPYGVITFTVALYSLYTFKYKHTNIIIIAIAACAGQVFYV